jgi:predicted ATP-dependent serine protease
MEAVWVCGECGGPVDERKWVCTKCGSIDVVEEERKPKKPKRPKES